MRRKDRQVTDRHSLEACIRECFFTTLAMVDNGRPYAVPVNFSYVDGTVYLHSARGGKKIDIVRKNGAVPVQLVFVATAALQDPGLEDTRACDLSSVYSSVIAEGELEEVTDTAEALTGMQAMLDHVKKGDKALAPEDLRNTLVLKVVIRSMTGKANNP